MDKAIATPAATANQSPLLQACEVNRRSGDRLLLDGVSLGVRGGDRVAIIGPTGSGKTLLLRSLALLDPLDGGTSFGMARKSAGITCQVFAVV